VTPYAALPVLVVDRSFGTRVLVAVLSIFPIARNAVGLDAVAISVVVPCTTNLAASKVGVVVPKSVVAP
jgi:hypothetical protein